MSISMVICLLKTHIINYILLQIMMFGHFKHSIKWTEQVSWMSYASTRYPLAHFLTKNIVNQDSFQVSQARPIWIRTIISIASTNAQFSRKTY
jgi:hypothetical protein